jgi:hypothetical protein
VRECLWFCLLCSKVVVGLGLCDTRKKFIISATEVKSDFVLFLFLFLFLLEDLIAVCSTVCSTVCALGNR